ncbi:VOC family protein [Nocardia crassostreae]|uniref:VOC family protein n=1 Tax=Nocardia crassostreae TaxID=53428 RepID=UPI0008337504|nr:VOC family protein [Nocardia crassostreae]
MTIRWVWAFLDRPAAQFDECAEFWATVTGSALSPRRGENSEFLTLLPESGASLVKMQAIAGDEPRLHLDLDVDDIPAETRRAVGLGATLVLEHPDYTVLKSPHGMIFCLTPAGRGGGELTPTVVGPEGDRSRLDQVTLDIGAADHDDEVRFWKELTGWNLTASTLPEFTRLRADPQQAINLLLQRLGADRPTSAHVDLACTDRHATAAWHEKLGARRLAEGSNWLVMTDPAGQVYCLTGRTPA